MKSQFSVLGGSDRPRSEDVSDAIDSSHEATLPTMAGADQPAAEAALPPWPPLQAFGWDDRYVQEFAPFAALGLVPARVAIGHREGYRLYTALGEVEARVAGRLRRAQSDQRLWPAVGDWVGVRLIEGERRGTIEAVVPRRTRFSRKATGSSVEEQVIAANIDTVLLVCGLHLDFNLRRLERFLVLAWESGARPAIVLSKADLCDDVQSKIWEVEAIAPGVPIQAISSLHNRGLESLQEYLVPGQTVVLLGSSGAGKSTLINRLVGREMLRTGEVRARDGRGRHTTTQRELVVLPGGALIIDTPGLRELQLWEASEGHQAAFGDVEQLVERCHFPDCSHQVEPRCALRQALNEGSLSAERFESYLKLLKELRHLEVQLDQRAQLAEKQQNKAIHKRMRNYQPRG